MEPDHSELPVTGYPRVKRKPPRASIGEHVAAVVFVTVIAAIVIVPNVLGRNSRSKDTNMVNLAMLKNGVDQFRLDCGRYPTEAEGLSALINAPKGATGWNGPYFPGDIPRDPWGNRYRYTDRGPLGCDGFELKSFGADAKPGGSGENADIEAGSE